MVSPRRSTAPPMVVDVPLLYRDEGTRKMGVAVLNPDRAQPIQIRTFEIADHVAQQIFGSASSPYPVRVESAMQKLADSGGKTRRHKELARLLNAPSQQFGREAEGMRARLEKVRQIVEEALSGEQAVSEAVESHIAEVGRAEFVTGAAAVATHGDVQVSGRMRERGPDAAVASVENPFWREGPAVREHVILDMLADLAAQPGLPTPLIQDLGTLRDKLAGVSLPNLVWGDQKNRTLLKFVQSQLLELTRDSALLHDQRPITASDPNPRDPGYKLAYVARWIDGLTRAAETKPQLSIADIARVRDEVLQRLATKRETAPGRQARELLTTASDIEIQSNKSVQDLSDYVQWLVNKPRGSFEVKMHGPDSDNPGTFIVSHRYVPELVTGEAPGSALATAPSSAGKEKPVLTSGRQILDADTGHAILALGRLNTADRDLDAQIFILSELYEDPRTAPLATKVFIDGVRADEKDRVEFELRKLPLPTGLSWMMEHDRLVWFQEGDVWKPRLRVSFLDLSLMTPGLGGVDTGDTPPWDPKSGFWKRTLRPFLAELRWSEQEAALAQLMYGEQFEIMGIPVELQTMMISRAFNVFGEKGPLRSLSGIQENERRLSQPTEMLLHARFEQRKEELDKELHVVQELLARDDQEVANEGERLRQSLNPTDRLRGEQLLRALAIPRAEREARPAELARQRARLEGLWKVGFDEKFADPPEIRMVALVELSKELNIRIGAHCKSGKDRTGNFVGLFVATREFFKTHPHPENYEDVAWLDPDRWADYIASIPKQPLFTASMEVVDHILNQQQADMMQMHRSLDRSPVSARLMGKSKPPPNVPATGHLVGQVKKTTGSSEHAT